MVTIDEFIKFEFKIGKVIEAKDHPNADKLVVLKVDLGETEEISGPDGADGLLQMPQTVKKYRQIVAGIKKSYTPDLLIGKNIVVVSNLEPAVLRGIESQGMLLAASDEDGISVISPDRDVKIGSRVK